MQRVTTGQRQAESSVLDVHLSEVSSDDYLHFEVDSRMGLAFFILI